MESNRSSRISYLGYYNTVHLDFSLKGFSSALGGQISLSAFIFSLQKSTNSLSVWDKGSLLNMVCPFSWSTVACILICISFWLEGIILSILSIDKQTRISEKKRCRQLGERSEDTCRLVRLHKFSCITCGLSEWDVTLSRCTICSESLHTRFCNFTHQCNN